jgi:hypothetical protein
MTAITDPLCQTCKSTGVKGQSPCPDCGGTGRIAPRNLKAERRVLLRDCYPLEQKERKGTLTEEESARLVTLRAALATLDAEPGQDPPPQAP